MSEKRFIVRLSEQERGELLALVKNGKVAAKKRLRAQVLLKADQGGYGPAWADGVIGDALDTTPDTVRVVRRLFVEEGLESTLNRKKQCRPSRKKIFDGEKEARLIALACGKAPEGRAKWTLHLLADQLVELKIVDAVSHETVRTTLKKMN